MQFFSSVFLTLGVALLVACDADRPDALLEDYASRVARVLKEELPPLRAAPLPALPDRRYRLQTQEAVREGFLDVFRLRHCGLLALVGERNSSLGLVQRPSTRLVYEQQLLKALVSCAGSEATGQQLKAQLSGLIDTKTTQWPFHVWNALYASEELERQFSRSEEPLPLGVVDGVGDVRRALAALDQWLTVSGETAWEAPGSLVNIEDSYEVLYRSSYLPGLMQSVQLLTASLDQVAGVIESRLERRPLCFQGRANNEARVLKNVFMNVYATEVQPYLATVFNDSRVWFDTQDRWISTLPAPSAMSAFRLDYSAMTEGSVRSNFIAARDRHTKAWQKVLGQCGLMPGGVG